ncbi:MAG TPA: hypothetical protein VL866_17030, partial [Pyrinomonadaceae bacterium]|nr:hypothetical protein [Pyrinomonadaceae bacterium]
MADAPERGESPSALIARKEPEVPAQDPIVSRSTSGLMLICALLLTASLAWALYDEAFGQRPWKGIQKEFVARYGRYLDSIKSKAGVSEKEVKESPEYQALEEEAKAARSQVQAEADQLQTEVNWIQKKLNAVTEPFQNQRGKLTVINYNVETSQGTAKRRYEQQAQDKMKEIVWVDMPVENDPKRTQAVKMDYAALEKTYNDLRDEKATKLGKKADLLKPAQEADKKRDDYLKNQLIGWTPSQIDSTKKSLDSFNYSILGHQVSVMQYNLVDRCQVCHLNVTSPLNIKASDMAPDGPGKTPDGLARAFVSHPNRELLEVHKPEKFGCASCHWGNGRATTSEEKGHGRHRFWLWPMFEKENTQAGCQQCHAKDRVTQGAETLNLGRDLFSQRGCMGCHRYEGFDRETDALASTRQTIGQLQDQITANDKQMREETARAGDEKTSEDDAKRL